MTDTPQWLAERLHSEGKKTLEFFETLNEEQWLQRIYSEGSQWTVRHILAHFVATEAAFDLLIRDILDGGQGAPADFDIDRFNERRVRNMDESTLNDLLKLFASLRSSSVRLVASMSAEDLQRGGIHPWLGSTKMVEIVRLLYRHNQIHQRDVRKILNIR